MNKTKLSDNTHKVGIPKFGILKIGFYILFGIWFLQFGICIYPLQVSPSIFPIEYPFS